MASITQVKSYLESTYAESVKKVNEIAINHNGKITCSLDCFDYDKIKDSVARGKCQSADILLLKKFIYFIELKTGFATKKKDVNVNTHLENLKLKIKLKAYESLSLFEKIILPEIENGVLDEKIQKKYIAVIDSNEKASDAYCDILQEKSGEDGETREEIKKIYEDSLLNYRKSVQGGKFIFYEGTEVWYDFEFDERIVRAK